MASPSELAQLIQGGQLPRHGQLPQNMQNIILPPIVPTGGQRPGGVVPGPPPPVQQAPGAIPGAVPPVGQYPGVQGNNPASRLMSKLRDPRVQAWLLSVAQGLAQPRGVGQTGVTNAVNALGAGYQSVALANRMQQEAEKQNRTEQREQGTFEDTLSNTAEARKTEGTRRETLTAQADSAAAQAERDRAQIAAMPEEQNIRRRQVLVDEKRLEAMVNQDERQWEQTQANADRAHEMALTAYQQADKRNAEAAVVDKLRLKAAQTQANAALVSANAAKLRAEREQGGLTPEALADLRKDFILSQTKARGDILNPLSKLPQAEWNAYLNSAVSDFDRLIGGAPTSEAPTSVVSNEPTFVRTIEGKGGIKMDLYSDGSYRPHEGSIKAPKEGPVAPPPTPTPEKTSSIGPIRQPTSYLDYLKAMGSGVVGANHSIGEMIRGATRKREDSN